MGYRKDITSDDLLKLKYTNSVFKETLRLWPPVSAISRETMANFKINNYEIPEKTWIQVQENIDIFKKNDIF